MDFVPLWWPPKNAVYFFSGDEYCRYIIEQNRKDDGYPLKIGEHWLRADIALAGVKKV